MLKRQCCDRDVDRALERVLDGHEPDVDRAVGGGAQHVGHAAERHPLTPRQVGLGEQGLLTEGGLGTEVRHGHRFLQGQSAGHDFAVNGPQRFAGHRSRIEFANAVQDRPLAVRRINLFACFDLDFTYGQDVFGALVEQLNNVRIELINRLAVFGNGHSGGGPEEVGWVK